MLLPLNLLQNWAENCILTLSLRLVPMRVAALSLKRKERQRSGKNKEPKPKLFGPYIFGWGGGLPREGVGAKKFGMPFKAQGNQAFWRDITGFARISRGCLKSLRKMFVFNSRPLKGRAEEDSSHKGFHSRPTKTPLENASTDFSWGGRLDHLAEV